MSYCNMSSNPQFLFGLNIFFISATNSFSYIRSLVAIEKKGSALYESLSQREDARTGRNQTHSNVNKN